MAKCPVWTSFIWTLKVSCDVCRRSAVLTSGRLWNSLWCGSCGHSSVIELRTQHTALKHFPTHCTWTLTVRGPFWGDNSKCLIKWLLDGMQGTGGIYKPVFYSTLCAVVVSFGGISCSFDTSFHWSREKKNSENWLEGSWEATDMFGKGNSETLSFLKTLCFCFVVKTFKHLCP